MVYLTNSKAMMELRENEPEIKKMCNVIKKKKLYL